MGSRRNSLRRLTKREGQTFRGAIEKISIGTAGETAIPEIVTAGEFESRFRGIRSE